MSKPTLEVAVGVLLNQHGQVLLGKRPADKPWPGWWELPGGKIEAGESVIQALVRELREELGIETTHAHPWVTYTHEYPKNFVKLSFCLVREWEGEPQCLEGQELAWVNPKGPLEVGPVLPATEPPLKWLQLPERSRLGRRAHQLGVDLCLGAHVWDRQHKLRICLGPLDREQYLALLPGGQAFTDLVAWVAEYLGHELDWDLNLVLKQPQVPALQLDGRLRLGFDTWLGQPANDAKDLTLARHYAEQATSSAHSRSTEHG